MIDEQAIKDFIDKRTIKEYDVNINGKKITVREDMLCPKNKIYFINENNMVHEIDIEGRETQ